MNPNYLSNFLYITVLHVLYTSFGSASCINFRCDLQSHRFSLQNRHLLFFFCVLLILTITCAELFIFMRFHFAIQVFSAYIHVLLSICFCLLFFLLSSLFLRISLVSLDLFLGSVFLFCKSHSGHMNSVKPCTESLISLNQSFFS